MRKNDKNNRICLQERQPVVNTSKYMHRKFSRKRKRVSMSYPLKNNKNKLLGDFSVLKS